MDIEVKISKKHIGELTEFYAGKLEKIRWQKASLDKEIETLTAKIQGITNLIKFAFRSLPELLKAFPDDQSARTYLEKIKWGGTPICPFCGSDKWYKLKDGKTYKCGKSNCYKKYTVTVGTLFHSSHIPLNIWFAGMYLISSHKKGISSHQLAKDLGITQKSAWFLAHRVREMVRDKNPEVLKGVVEATHSKKSFIQK